MIAPTAAAAERPPPHRPGTGTRPETTFLQPLIAALPVRVDESNWQTIECYAEGFRLARAGYYWEAHEAWEAVWHRTAPQSRPHHLLRGLIQIANAELKRALGQPKAALRLIQIAAEHLAAATPYDPTSLVMGASPTALITELRRQRNASEYNQNYLHNPINTAEFPKCAANPAAMESQPAATESAARLSSGGIEFNWSAKCNIMHVDGMKSR